MAATHAHKFTDPSSQEDRAVDAFLFELTQLCRRHGLMLTGQPVLAFMDPEEEAFSYKSDDESRLFLA